MNYVISAVVSDFSYHYGKSTTYSAGTLQFSTIQGRVNANKPIYTRILWNDGKSHAVVISGYDISGQMLRIMDPGESLKGAWQYYSRSSLVGGTYRGIGTWTHYFYVD